MIDFLKAVYCHLRENGVYQTDLMDRLFWASFLMFCLFLIFGG